MKETRIENINKGKGIENKNKKQVGFKLQIKTLSSFKTYTRIRVFFTYFPQFVFISAQLSDPNTMQSNDSYYSEQYQNQEQDNNVQQYFAKQKLRKQAFNRNTDYKQLPVTFFDHQQINNKQSQELRKELVGLYKPKVELMRSKFDLEIMEKDYENHYQQFIKMTLKNQMQERQLTDAISEMHQMADLLISPPSLKDENLFIYSKVQPNPSQQEQIDTIFRRYQIAYKQCQEVEENHAEQTIRRAKQFLRDRYA